MPIYSKGKDGWKGKGGEQGSAVWRVCVWAGAAGGESVNQGRDCVFSSYSCADRLRISLGCRVASTSNIRHSYL